MFNYILFDFLEAGEHMCHSMINSPPQSPSLIPLYYLNPGSLITNPQFQNKPKGAPRTDVADRTAQVDTRWQGIHAMLDPMGSGIGGGVRTGPEIGRAGSLNRRHTQSELGGAWGMCVG